MSLHTEDKLRTVLWGWAGKPVDDDTLEAVGRCAISCSATSASSCAGTSPSEIDALYARAAALLDESGDADSPIGVGRSRGRRSEPVRCHRTGGRILSR